MKDTKIYEILDAFETKDRWHLGSPIDPTGKEVDPRLFTEGEAIPFSEMLFVPISTGSKPVDFTLGAFDMPVVKHQIAIELQKLEPSSVQRIPVVIEPQLHGYEILNVTSTLKCLDERRSEIVWWNSDDGRPEKTGRYRGIGNKVLLSDVVAGHKIFRLSGWTVALFVGQEVKELMEGLRATGVAFKQVELS